MEIDISRPRVDTRFAKSQVMWKGELQMNQRGYGYNKPMRKTTKVKRYTRRDACGRKHIKKLVRVKAVR